MKRTLTILALLLVVAAGLGLAGYYVYHWAWGAEAQLRAARLALDRGDFAEAEAQLTRYLTARPRSAEGHLLAAQAARRAVEPFFGGDAAPFAWRGRVRTMLGSDEGALADYRRAVELAPENGSARLGLAEALVAAGKAEEAEGHIEFLRERHAGNPDVLLALARCRRSLG